MLCGRSCSLCDCAKWSNMIHSYTFLHFDKTSRCNHTQAIGHNCFPQLLYTSSCAAYPCIVNRALPLWMALRCLVGLDQCHVVMEKKSQRPLRPVCKVFVPAIVSKRLLMMRGPHAVIISVSQGYDIVAVPRMMMSCFFLL